MCTPPMKTGGFCTFWTGLIWHILHKTVIFRLPLSQTVMLMVETGRERPAQGGLILTFLINLLKPVRKAEKRRECAPL